MNLAGNGARIRPMNSKNLHLHALPIVSLTLALLVLGVMVSVSSTTPNNQAVAALTRPLVSVKATSNGLASISSTQQSADVQAFDVSQALNAAQASNLNQVVTQALNSAAESNSQH